MTESDWAEPQDWSNPLRRAKPLPHLGEIIFAQDDESESGKLALKLLERFYSAARVLNHEQEELDKFLDNPSCPILLIEGSAGIGKTWFVRYNLLVRKHAYQGYCGVIDMLRHTGTDVRKTLMTQLVPIIDRYFVSIGTSFRLAIQLVLDRKYRLRHGISQEQALSEPQLATIANDALSLIDSRDIESLSQLRLQALEEVAGPYLFIVIDNLDRLSLAAQEDVLTEVVRICRNARVRLIVPIRTTSKYLNSWFSGLRQYHADRMKLSSLKVKEMLRPRFEYGSSACSLPTGPIVRDHGTAFSYRDLYTLLVGGDTGLLIDAIGQANARVVFEAVDRILYSDHLGALRNLSDADKAIQALMLADHRRGDQTSLLINLLGPVEGKNARDSKFLLFRVAETVRSATPGHINFAEQDVRDHLFSYGYENERLIILAIAQLVGSGVVVSDDGLDHQAILDLSSLADLGEFRASPLCDMYFNLLLNKSWYYFAVKRTLVGVIDGWVSRDDHRGYQYMSHSDLYGYLNEIEEFERRAREQWKGNGRRVSTIVSRPLRPTQLAKRAIGHGSKGH